MKLRIQKQSAERPICFHTSNFKSHHLSNPITKFKFGIEIAPKLTFKSIQHIHKIQITTHASTSPPPDTQNTSTAIFSPKRLAIFVSGGGSNFKAIHHQIQQGRINAQVAVVVTNAPSCGGAEYARHHDIPVAIFPPKSDHPSFISISKETLTETLQSEYSVDYIILAGYMKLIPVDLVRAYHRAILNIHPGLLPSFGGKGFYGKRVHEAVIQSGARVSGPTVHFVDEEYDTGPILAQDVVCIDPFDTADRVAEKVLALEHSLYPKCVAALCDGRITWNEHGIPILWNAH